MWAWCARFLRPRLDDDAGVLLFQGPEKRSWSPGVTRLSQLGSFNLTSSSPDALFIPTTRYLYNSTCNRCLPTAIIDSVRSHFLKPVGPGMCMTDNSGWVDGAMYVGHLPLSRICRLPSLQRSPSGGARIPRTDAVTSLVVLRKPTPSCMP